jgi:hypothetical protein
MLVDVQRIDRGEPTRVVHQVVVHPGKELKARSPILKKAPRFAFKPNCSHCPTGFRLRDSLSWIRG